MVLFVITFGMLFIVGANFWQFILLIGTGILLFIWLVLSASYRLKRFTGFLEPFKDPYGTGFQLTNSLMAFGRGEISGEGLGNSIQNSIIFLKHILTLSWRLLVKNSVLLVFLLLSFF